MNERRVYRSRGPAIIMGLFALAALFAISLPALLLLVSGSQTNAPSQLFFVVLGVALFAVAFRLAICGIYVETTGVRVLNPFSVRRIRWENINKFVLGRWGLLPQNCLIVLFDNTRVGVWGISARNRIATKRDLASEGLICDLNDLLESRRAEEPPN